MTLGSLMDFIFNYVTHLYGHGRPFSDSFIHLFSWLGWRLGGLWMIYVIGYLIVLATAVAFYLLVRRIHGQVLAFAAGIFFVLYSADTTQAYLTHSLGLFPSLLFLLLGFHAYLSRRLLLAYGLLVLALLTYETTYFVFMVAPLLTATSWQKEKASELVQHVGIIAAIFLAVLLIRSRLGDDRIMDVQGWSLFLTPLRHMLVGPMVSLSSYLLRSYHALRTFNPGQIIWVLPAFMGGLVFMQSARIRWVDRSMGEDLRPIQSGGALARPYNHLRIKWNNLPPSTRKLLSILVTAILMVVLAYPLTFTTRSFSISGRATRVHFAAAPGVALFWGGILVAALEARRKSLLRLLTTSSLALILPLMCVFGFKIQADYKTAWVRQQSFWGELLPLIAPAEAGTAILVAPSVFHDVEQIDANTWNLPRILPQLLQLPEEWTIPPMVYRLVPGWEKWIVDTEGKFDLFNLTVMAPPSTYRAVDPSNVIFIDKEDGAMRRVYMVTIEGESYILFDGAGDVSGQFDGALLLQLLGLAQPPSG